VGIRTPAEIEVAYEKIGQAAAEALIVLPSPQLTLPHREKIMEHAKRLGLPTLASIIHVKFPGALFQMAPNFADYPRRVAAYVDRILKGAKPGDLPVEQPNKYDLVVDLRAARTLGLTIPRSVLLRADKVLE
jgi:putative ABC transport system substrate-binding protein